MRIFLVSSYIPKNIKPPIDIIDTRGETPANSLVKKKSKIKFRSHEELEIFKFMCEKCTVDHLIVLSYHYRNKV